MNEGRIYNICPHSLYAHIVFMLSWITSFHNTLYKNNCHSYFRHETVQTLRYEVSPKVTENLNWTTGN